MKLEIIAKWRCDRCEKDFDEKSEAEYCCRPKPFEVQVCGICGERVWNNGDQHLRQHTEYNRGTSMTAKEAYLEALRFGQMPIGGDPTI